MSGIENSSVTADAYSQQLPPSLQEYYAGLDNFVTFGIVFCSLLMLPVCVLYYITMRNIFSKVRSEFLTHTIILISVYPLCAVSALLIVLIPRSMIISDTVTHLAFCIGGYTYFSLCIRYAGGAETLIKEAANDTMVIRTPPCCCCCTCIPSLAINANKILFLKYMVLQMPIIQSFLMIILNVIYLQSPELYSNTVYFFIPFMVASFLTGVWGMNITFTMSENYAKDFNLKRKYFSIQLVLIIGKLFPLILTYSLKAANFHGKYPMTDGVWTQTIIRIIEIPQLLGLQWFALKSYQLGGLKTE